jgi:hypothetical protein
LAFKQRPIEANGKACVSLRYSNFIAVPTHSIELQQSFRQSVVMSRLHLTFMMASAFRLAAFTFSTVMASLVVRSLD